MIRNYFKVAWRNLLHNKAFASLNILGLAIGMATAILIGLWVNDELSYDNYNPNHKNLGEVLLTEKNKSDVYTGTTIAMPLGAALHANHQDIFKQVALVSFHNLFVLSFRDQKIPARGMYAEQAFPDMFGVHIIDGNMNVLKDPSTIMIASSLAKSLFGNESAINKTVLMDTKLTMKVGAVYEDFPENASFAGTVLLLPWMNPSNNYLNQNTTWNDHNGQLYVQLIDQVTPEQATARIKNIPTPL